VWGWVTRFVTLNAAGNAMSAWIERGVPCHPALHGGIVSKKEQVRLAREPTNPYDRNAIRVLNIRDEQVGHLPRDAAVGPAEYCSPRHRKPFNSRNEGSKCVG